MIDIIVCIKQVLDPEAPRSCFQIDPEAKRAVPAKGTPPVLNPFDENALEAALRIKDAQGGKITVISMGRRLAKPVLKKSLAVGADDLILLEDESFDSFDSYFTAYMLATAIKRIGRYDLILCGRQAADTNNGQIGLIIAEILGIPSVIEAQKVEMCDSLVRVERVVSDGYEVVETTVPALVTVSSQLGDLRPAAIKAIMEAQKKNITVWNAQNIGTEAHPANRTTLLELFIPIREIKCEIVEGDTPAKAAENLALKLREAKII